MHFNPLDLLLIGIFIYILVRHFKRMGQGPRRPGPRNGHQGDQEEARKQASDAYERAQRAWDMLRDDEQHKQGDERDVPDVEYSPQAAADNVESHSIDAQDIPQADGGRRAVPDNFDEDEFLEGAKAFCVRIRQSWNNRDLMDLREFCTEECMEELRNRAQRESRPARQDILQVNAGLVEVRDLDNGGQTATVYYEITEKDASSNHTHVTREIWRYGRSEQTSWLLESILPVQDEETKPQ